MRPVKIARETHLFGAPKDWDETTMGRCEGLSIRANNDQRGVVLESAWLPEPAEVQAIINGAPIVLTIFGVSHPAVSLRATDLSDIATPVRANSSKG